MNERIGLILALAVLAGCQTDGLGPMAELEVRCESPRPEVCTFQYDPVCGLQREPDGNWQWRTHGNACTACSDPQVIGHKQGECGAEALVP